LAQFAEQAGTSGRGGAVRLANINKTYPGGDRLALDDVSLDIEPGSFFSILGPSGCGKTTMLRIVAGFEYPNDGRVIIGSRDVTGLSPRNRDIAMVFQDYALYPHMTVENNIGFNLRNAKMPRTQVRDRVSGVAEKLEIGHLLKKRPGHLSGGEQQRVALGRAMIRQPAVFLMDEPLSNLDVKLRELMRIEIGQLHQDLGVTTIYVTHDQAEALTLSTQMAVMRDGRLQQCGPPDEVYARPANVFVARFIGTPSMNVFVMRRDGSVFRGASDPEATLPLATGVDVADGEEVLVGVRPHDLRIAGDGSGVPVVATLVEHLGRNNFVICAPRAEDDLYDAKTIQIETAPDVAPAPGTELSVTADAACIRVFDRSGEARWPVAEPRAVSTAQAG
jgi:multiple sugar transport system ATP-binding protein